MRHTVDTKFKMSAAKRGLYDGERNPMHGRRHTPEARAAVAAARRGTVWIHCGDRTKWVRRGDLESYVLAGWLLGRR